MLESMEISKKYSAIFSQTLVRVAAGVEFVELDSIHQTELHQVCTEIGPDDRR